MQRSPSKRTLNKVVEEGYEFFGDQQLVTVFSAPNYMNEFDNCGAVMYVDGDLLCSFQVLKPLSKKKKKCPSWTTWKS